MIQNPFIDPDFSVQSYVVNYILAQWPLKHEILTPHGPSHWRRVARYTHLLCSSGNEEYQDFSYEEWKPYLGLFALFHDCRRAHDGECFMHGPRAAEYVARMEKKKLLSEFDGGKLEWVKKACEFHTVLEVKYRDSSLIEGTADERMFLFTCLDSDRLDIGRVGYRVDHKYLFTETARGIANAFNNSET